MPTIPVDDAVLDQIEVQMEARGVPAALSTAVVQAIDAAGYAIEPQGGGAPVAALTSLVATTASVQGKPGWYVHEVTMADASKVRVLEIPGAKGAPPQYVRV